MTALNIAGLRPDPDGSRARARVRATWSWPSGAGCGSSASRSSSGGPWPRSRRGETRVRHRLAAPRRLREDHRDDPGRGAPAGGRAARLLRGQAVEAHRHHPGRPGGEHRAGLPDLLRRLLDRARRSTTPTTVVDAVSPRHAGRGDRPAPGGHRSSRSTGSAGRDDFAGASSTSLQAPPGPGGDGALQRAATEGCAPCACACAPRPTGGQRVGKLGFTPRAEGAGPNVSSGPVGGIVDAGSLHVVRGRGERQGASGSIFTSEKARDERVQRRRDRRRLQPGLRGRARHRAALHRRSSAWRSASSTCCRSCPWTAATSSSRSIEKLKGVAGAAADLRAGSRSRASPCVALVFVFALQNDIGRLTGDGLPARADGARRAARAVACRVGAVVGGRAARRSSSSR